MGIRARATAVLSTGMLVGSSLLGISYVTMLVLASPASAQTIAYCNAEFSSGPTEQPSNWLAQLQSTAGFGNNPSAYPYMTTWSNGLESIPLSKIACRESDYNYSALPNGPVYGEWQVTATNICTYLCPLGNTESQSISCYMNGCDGLPNWYFQDWVAMRYVMNNYGATAQQVYGSSLDAPQSAWDHEIYGGYILTKP